MFWHISEGIFQPEQIIPRGRWGSTIIQQGSAHHLFKREAILEKSRLAINPCLPCRYTCAYAFDDLASAKKYQSQMGVMNQFIYEAEMANASATFSKHDILWVTWMNEVNRTPEQSILDANSYWFKKATKDLKSDVDELWEILIDSDLRVIRQSP